jgi:protease-4
MDTEAILERRRLRRRASFWRVAAIVILVGAIAIVASYAWDMEGFETGGGHVAEIKVDGFITTRPDAVEVIDTAAKAPAVKAILLRINSGGGAASGGESLYRSIRKASEQKPVVAVIDGLGASAAYMAAIAADHVVARETAITGSIGVIFQYAHFEELLQKVGAEYEEIKSAPLKGEPSIFDEPAPGAEEMIRSVVDDTYDWFVDIVAERRGLAPGTARNLADGRIFTGRQAVAQKLIDEVGGDEEARAWLSSEKGVAEDIPAREWEKDQSFISAFGADAVAGFARLAGLDLSAASILPQRLVVDGLLSVWQAPAVGDPIARGASGDQVGAH